MSDPSPELDFRAIDEPHAGAKWQARFREYWPAYEKWFLREGDDARPSRADAERALRRSMPELVPTYERLVDLAGGGDRAARFLSLYRPPPVMTACSQAVWTGEGPALVRNYDHAPHLCDGIILRSAWTGRTTVALTDCLWGAIDGINDDGLAVALAFGGRAVVGDGFAITLIVRYLLETCATVEEASAAVRRIRPSMTYNVTILDATGTYATAFLAPDRPAVVERRRACANHQRRIEWPAYARATRTVEREKRLRALLDDPAQTLGGLTREFLRPPLFQEDYRQGRGTLYTAVDRKSVV